MAAVAIIGTVDVAGHLALEASELDGGRARQAANAAGAACVCDGKTFPGVAVFEGGHGLRREHPAAVVEVVGRELAHRRPAAARCSHIPAKVHEEVVSFLIGVVYVVRQPACKVKCERVYFFFAFFCFCGVLLCTFFFYPSS